MDMRAMNPRAASGPWKRGWMRGFIGLKCPLNEGARKVGHCFARNATEKVKENYLSYGKGDEGEGEGEGRGCPGEA